MSKPLDATQFTLESAERIARVVRAAELGSPQAKALTFDSVAPQPAKIFRICTFTGAWAIGDSKTVTFRNVTTTPNTVNAVNLFFPIGTGQTSTLNCAIAKDGTAWYLVDVPMQTATAIFITSTQLGLVVTGTATGIAVTSTARGISIGSAATAMITYVTDVSISASLNTSSCSISVGKTLTTASATFLNGTGTATATFVTGTSTALFVTGTATVAHINGTYTGTYLRLGY